MKVFHFDNFLENPHDERRNALSARYETLTHRNITYRGIARISEDPESQGKLQKILGCEGGSWEIFWRRYFESEENETYIHNDVLIGQFSAILFLSDPADCKGGVAFWRHKLYGWTSHPSPAEVAALGIKDTPEFWESLFQDGFDESKWEMADYVPMEFNRLVVFWSPRFHSRFPKKPFGTALANSRLIKTFFYFPGEPTVEVAR